MERKVALITGSSRGMWKAEAIEFAKNGYNIVINYVKNKEKADQVKKYIEEEYNVKVLSIQADLSKEEDIKRLVNGSLNEFNKIDVLINNAGIAPYGNFEKKQ